MENKELKNLTAKFKDYSEKYIVQDYICEGVAEYIFVVESPHNDELEHKYPLAGSSGKEIVRFIGIDSNKALGEYLKENRDVKISIINVSNTPLQKTNELEESYSDLVDKLDKIVRQGCDSYGRHQDKELNEIEKTIYEDFKKRYTDINKDKNTKVIICGKFARTYFELLVNKSVKEEYIYRVPHPARYQWRECKNDLDKIENIMLDKK